MKNPPQKTDSLPKEWEFRDIYGDGSIIAFGHGGTTAWIEPEGDVLALGDKEGVAQGYIPLKVIDAMRKFNWNDGIHEDCSDD